MAMLDATGEPFATKLPKSEGFKTLYEVADNCYRKLF